MTFSASKVLMIKSTSTEVKNMKEDEIIKRLDDLEERVKALEAPREFFRKLVDDPQFRKDWQDLMEALK